MAIKIVNPYIQVNDGAARRAIELYKTALGAEVSHLMTFGDMPGEKMPEDKKNQVMHSELKIGSQVIMVSDSMEPKGQTPGDMVHIVLQFDDLDEQARAFDALSKGGQATQPLVDAFWGDRFGVATDPFGVRWMFVCPLKKA